MRHFLICCALLTSTQASFAAGPDDITPDAVRAIVEVLASDDMAGRKPGEPGGVAARGWIVDWLAREGFTPAGTGGTFEQPFEQGANVLALTQAGETPRILLSAHFDHHGSRCRKHPAATSNVCNGAADNATGVALALLVAKHLKETSNVPVAVALWDAEEMGLKGSLHFVQNPAFETSSLQLMMNFDIIGLNLFKGFEDHHFVIGSETGGTALTEDLTAVMQGAATTFHPVSYAFGHFRSDITSFVLAGYELPFVFFSDGDGTVYHTTADEPKNINYRKAADVGVVAMRLADKAVARAQGYAYRKPNLSLGTPLPTYDDIATLLAGVTAARAHAAENGLTTKDVVTLGASEVVLRKIQEGGPEKFGMIHAAALGKIAQELLALSARLTIIP